MPPTPTPAERFASTLQALSQAVAARTGWSLTLQLIAHIINRIQQIKQRFARLAARIQNGSYAPRRCSPRRLLRQPQARRPDPLPHTVGWLLQLVPEAIGYRGQLEYLFQDPEMVALLAAAPASMRRPLRSLCRMLRLDPPPILDPPRPALRSSAAAKPEAPPTRPSPAAPPPSQARPEPMPPPVGVRSPPITA